jgi:arginase family enzyme
LQKPPDSLSLPRFCGVAGFMRLKVVEDPQGLDVAILGLPSDNGSPFRTGARFGPQAIRAASVMLRPINPYRGHVDVFAHCVWQISAMPPSCRDTCRLRSISSNRALQASWKRG